MDGSGQTEQTLRNEWVQNQCISQHWRVESWEWTEDSAGFSSTGVETRWGADIEIAGLVLWHQRPLQHRALLQSKTQLDIWYCGAGGIVEFYSVEADFIHKTSRRHNKSETASWVHGRAIRDHSGGVCKDERVWRCAEGHYCQDDHDRAGN